MRKILFLLVGLLAYCQAESQNREIEFEKSTLQDALNKATAAGKWLSWIVTRNIAALVRQWRRWFSRWIVLPTFLIPIL